MGLPGWGDKTADAVPGGTIRNNWDPFEHSSFSGAEIGSDRIDGHNYENTTTTRGGWPSYNYHGRYSSGRVPIGAWASIHDGNCSSGSQIDHIGWGINHWTGGRFPGKIDDQLATDCGGYGNADGWNHTRSHYIDNNSNTQATACYIGNKYANGEDDEENCLKAGVQWPAFCQLGDYVGTQSKCKSYCANAKSTSGDAPCNWALDRLCGKTREDNVKKNGNTYIKSDRDWIQDPVCKSYCGDAGTTGSNTCQSSKTKFCTNQRTWPESQEYCYDYWKKNPNTTDMNTACSSKLSSSSSPENISTGVGCGALCGGGDLDVDKTWCDSKRQEFCTANHNNMGTQYCFNFCKDQPDLCEHYLQTNFCKDKDNKLDFTVGDTGKKYSDWCGCMMGTQFYDDYRDSVFKQFEDEGYNIEGISAVRSEPECMYPKCKGGSILSSDQRDNIGQCGSSCVQIMLNSFDDSDIGGDFYANQEANCSNIRIDTVDDIPVDVSNPDNSPSVEELPMLGGTGNIWGVGIEGVPLTEEQIQEVESSNGGLAGGIIVGVILIAGFSGLIYAYSNGKWIFAPKSSFGRRRKY